MKIVLTNSRLFLKYATLPVIESLRLNSELHNFVIYDSSNNNTTIFYGSNYTSLAFPGQQQQQSFNDIHIAFYIEI